MPLQMNVPRHDTDFAFPGRNHAWTVRTHQPRVPLLQKLPAFDHVDHGNAFRDADNQRDARVSSFHNRVSRIWGRDEDDCRIGAGGFHGAGHSVENRPVQMRRPAFARRDAAHDVCSIRDRLLRVESPFPAREALHEQARVLID